MPPLSSEPAFHYYGDADFSGDEMEEVSGSSKRRVTRSEAKGSGEGGGVGQGRAHDKMNDQFTSPQQCNRGPEKEVKNLERVVSLVATEVEELQLQLQLPDRHPERRVKQVGAISA